MEGVVPYFVRLLCVYLGVLCLSAVKLATKYGHRRGAEYAELTQRIEAGALPMQEGKALLFVIVSKSVEC